MKFKKVLAGALAAVVAVGSLSIEAFAYEYTGKTVTYGDFTFEEQSDGTLAVKEYNGDDLHVVIPDKVNGKTVTIIGQFAFGDFTDIMNPYSMTSIEIPNTITTIEFCAFLATPSIEYIYIPASVNSIDDSSFTGMRALQTITVDQNNKSYADVDGVLFNKDITEVITYPHAKTETTYAIPETVTTISDGAFSNDYLISVSIPASVKEIDSMAFYGLQELNVDENNKSFASIDGVLFNKDITKIVKYPYGKTETSYTIPDTVTIIGDHSFAYTSLESIKIPDGVTAIEDSAFDNGKLTSIDLPDTLISIGDRTFYGCDFETIEVPNGVVSIGKEAFSACTSLTTAIIPDSVTDMGSDVLSSNTFRGCTSLTSVTLSKNVSSLHGTFEGCTSLTSIEIPDGVKEIDAFTFMDCTSLKSVTIPASVTSIYGIGEGEYEQFSAFNGCPDDMTIYGYTGSYAETYAKEKNINFVALGEVNSPTTTEAPAATTTEGSATTTTTEGSVATTTTPAASDNGTDDGNKPTGVVIALLPALATAAGVLISKKRK